jgi:predicted O-linked N-acetylglucosamine transferase (SPINDLY family)
MTPEETMRRAASAFAVGDFRESEELCKTTLSMRSDHLEALSLLGILNARAGRFEEAVVLLARVVQAAPINAVAHNNYGNILRDLHRFDAALASYDRAVKLEPAYAEAHHNRGRLLSELNRADEALSSYDSALKLKPNYAEAFHSRGVLLQELKRLEEAAANYQQAIIINPQMADSHYNLGNVLRDLRRYAEARQSYDNALAVKPGFAQAYNNRGNVMQELGRYEDALRSYEHALAINPDLAEAHINRGNVLQELKRFDDALDSYRRALRLKPDSELLLGGYLHTKTLICEWSGAGRETADLHLKIAQGRLVAWPLTVLALIDDPAVHRQIAELLAKGGDPVNRLLPPIIGHAKRDKIRVGYYSADYCNHATAYLAAGLFECHDRAAFHLVAFSFGPDKRDAMRERLSTAFDQFIDVRAKSDREVAQLSRNLEIDIAVDLKGFTRDARPGIFAQRAAPIQAGFLGYPGTMGARYIDYIIADETVIPAKSRPHFTEKVVYMPDSYQINDEKRKIGEAVSRPSLGLPVSAFVFCCFNSCYKITSSVFDCWMRILTRTPGSVLWLLGDNATAATNLRKAAAAYGVDSQRLIFAPHIPAAEHLARLRAADLFIDTLPYNAHTTASDALWAGVPVLTRCGESFAARVAASLLINIGLPELITTTEAQYEEMAVSFARHPALLAEVKSKLLKNRLTSPLFDTELFCRHIEDAYTQMYSRFCAGTSAEDIRVQKRKARV